MSNRSPKKAWQELYEAALFETDKNKAAGRIADAERVMVARARTFFHHPNANRAERNALDAALYGLRVLKLYTPSPNNPQASVPADFRNA